MNYALHIIIMFEIYLLLAFSTNLLVGYAGLVTLAQAAFYGIGAYISAILTVKMGYSFFPALLIAILGNMFLSILVGLFAVRLKDLYFTLATLAFQTIVYTILYNWQAVTEGSYGISGIPKPNFFSITIDTHWEFALFAGVLVAGSILFLRWLSKTPWLRLIKGLRNDQIALQTAGFNPVILKYSIVALASVFATMAGALYASFITYIDPTSFTVDESIFILSILLIGGAGNINGSIMGALFYILLPEILRFIHIPTEIAANVRMMIYALVLILVLRFKPSGFFGVVNVR